MTTSTSFIIEVVIFNRIGTFLQSSPNQFGFKPKHGTELCVYAFKELLRFYQKHGSAMHVAFLYSSKAFDRVNRRKLLLKLESRGVPTYILRLLSNELIGQYMGNCQIKLQIGVPKFSILKLE